MEKKENEKLKCEFDPVKFLSAFVEDTDAEDWDAPYTGEDDTNSSCVGDKISEYSSENIMFDFVKKVGNCYEINSSMNYLLAKIEILENEIMPRDIYENLQKNLELEDRVLLYLFCNFMLNDKKHEYKQFLRDIYSSDIRKAKIKEWEISCLAGKLSSLGFVELEYTEKDSDRNDERYVKVTMTGLTAVFGEDSKFFEGDFTGDTEELTEPEKIPSRELYFDGELGKEISDLKSCLRDEKFVKIQKRLAEEKQAKGICCLFYGEPGTGKTESVMQIAKETNRKVRKIDLSQIQGRYLGTSERNTKKIFTKYANDCKMSRLKGENIPILLLNEADGLLTKRMPAEGINSSIEQMENTMMDIFLNEMETFEGIMIATTNLADALDKAFERRFLFKIKFEKPSFETRFKIWKDKMQALSNDKVARLANEFDFSGGEIDNIKRKSIIGSLKSDKELDFSEIMDLCKQERIEKGHSIGFGR